MVDQSFRLIQQAANGKHAAGPVLKRNAQFVLDVPSDLFFWDFWREAESLIQMATGRGGISWSTLAASSC